MPETPATYGSLDKKLRSLGFTSRTVEGKARIYTHEANGAKVILPDAPFSETVLPHHLIVVQTVFEEYDIVDPADPTVKPQKAS